MNKTLVCSALVATLLAAGCSNNDTAQTRTNIQNAQTLHKIRHVCIVANPRLKQPAQMEHHLATALRGQGISSEIVAARNRNRLRAPACRYSLHYKGRGSTDVIHSFSLVLRTPERSISRVNFVEANAAYYQQQPNVQQQTDGIIKRMLGKL